MTDNHLLQVQGGAAGLHVTGGSDGFEARTDDLKAMAKLNEQASGDLLSLAAQCHLMLVDPDVLASVVLDPVGAAAFELALLGALDGNDGLTEVAGGIGLRSLQLRAAALRYEALDEANDVMFRAKNFFDTLGAVVDLPYAVGNSIEAALTGGSIKAPWQKLLAEHPGFVDEVVSDLPVVLWVASQGRIPPDGEGIARLLGMFYPDGHPVVAEIPFVDPTKAASKPPRTFGDLLAALDARNFERPPQIDVRVLEQTRDGKLQRSYIVNVPGMTDLSVKPGQNPGSVNDLATSLHTMAGDPGSHAEGIAQALRRAGADPNDPVMLVGNSQGGMTTVRAATEFDTSGRYNVTHVVTLGSPIANMPVPASVQVLALENEHDVIPHLDAADNPPSANRTTVTFAREPDSEGTDHSLRNTYLPAAVAVDSSADPSLVAYLNSTAGFLSADSVRNHAYTITRDY